MCLGGNTAPNPLKGFGEAFLGAALAGNAWLCHSPCSVGVVGSWLGFFENGVTSAGSGREGEAALAEPSRSWIGEFSTPCFLCSGRAVTRGGHRAAHASVILWFVQMMLRNSFWLSAKAWERFALLAVRCPQPGEQEP